MSEIYSNVLVSNLWMYTLNTTEKWQPHEIRGSDPEHPDQENLEMFFS